MNGSETEILEQIEHGLWQDDVAFGLRMTVRPRLSTWDKVRFAAIAYVGIIMVMMYPANMGLAVAGCGVLITDTIDIVRRHLGTTAAPRSPIDSSAHRLLTPRPD